jgi:hypothetical protein
MGKRRGFLFVSLDPPECPPLWDSGHGTRKDSRPVTAATIERDGRVFSMLVRMESCSTLQQLSENVSAHEWQSSFIHALVRGRLTVDGFH